jgi:hypothetical protein
MNRRIALHKFDPPDLKHAQQDATMLSDAMLVESPMEAVSMEKKSAQEEEMDRAKHQGLPVDFHTGGGSRTMVPCGSQGQSSGNHVSVRRVLFVQDDDEDDDDDEEEECSVPVHSSSSASHPVKTRQYYWPYGNSKQSTQEDELDRWEKKTTEDDLLVNYDDSDDDLL